MVGVAVGPQGMPGEVEWIEVTPDCDEAVRHSKSSSGCRRREGIVTVLGWLPTKPKREESSR